SESPSDPDMNHVGVGGPFAMEKRAEPVPTPRCQVVLNCQAHSRPFERESPHLERNHVQPHDERLEVFRFQRAVIALQKDLADPLETSTRGRILYDEATPSRSRFPWCDPEQPAG